MKLYRPLVVASMLLMGMPAAFADGTPVPAERTQVIAEAHAPEACAKINPISDVQRKQLSALRDKYELDTAEKKALLRVTKRQLREVMTAATVDKSAALALQAKINGLRDDLSNSRLNFMLAAGDVFTPEQREQFRRMHHGWGHHHHGFGHGGFGGHGFGADKDGGRTPVG